MTFEEARRFIGVRVSLSTRNRGTVGPGTVLWVSGSHIALNTGDPSPGNGWELKVTSLDDVDELTELSS